MEQIVGEALDTLVNRDYRRRVEPLDDAVRDAACFLQYRSNSLWLTQPGGESEWPDALIGLEEAAERPIGLPRNEPGYLKPSRKLGIGQKLLLDARCAAADHVHLALRRDRLDRVQDHGAVATA